jgi:hypothetical protein
MDEQEFVCTIILVTIATLILTTCHMSTRAKQSFMTKQGVEMSYTEAMFIDTNNIVISGKAKIEK